MSEAKKSNAVVTATFVCSVLSQLRSIPGMVSTDGLRSSVHFDGKEIPLMGIANTLKAPRPKRKGGRNGATTESTSSTHVRNWFQLLVCQYTQPLEVFVKYRTSLEAKKLTGVTSMNEYVKLAISRLSSSIDDNSKNAKTREDKAALEYAKATLESLRSLVVDRGGKRSTAATESMDAFDDDFSSFEESESE